MIKNSRQYAKQMEEVLETSLVRHNIKHSDCQSITRFDDEFEIILNDNSKRMIPVAWDRIYEHRIESRINGRFSDCESYSIPIDEAWAEKDLTDIITEELGRPDRPDRVSDVDVIDIVTNLYNQRYEFYILQNK